MSEWHAEVRRRLAPLRLPPERELEIVEEVAQHLDDRYREMRAGGQDEAAAAAEAWRELEAADVLGREVAKSELPQPADLPPPGAPGGGQVFVALWQDLRHAVQSLRRQPVFAITLLTALALSIGPTTAIISVGNWLFWRPLPGLTDANRLGVVRIGRWMPNGVSASNVSYQTFADLKTSFKTVAAFAGVQEQVASVIAGEEAPRQVGLSQVTADFFNVLGVRMAAGRSFTLEEGRLPGAPVAVISERLATRSFGSAAGALDRQLIVDRTPFQIVGVATSGFSGIATTSAIDVWITGATRNLDSFSTFIVRLAAGAGFAQCEAELGVLVHGLVALAPDGTVGAVTARVFPGLGVEPLSRPRTRDMLDVLLLIGGVLLVLGCANVANMLIARAIRRGRDVAVRKALGASTLRLVQLQLAESWLLAVGGAILGLGLAIVLKQIMQHKMFPFSPDGLTPVPIDLRVLALTMGTALVTGTIAGVAPAWLFARGSLTGAAGSSGGARTTTRAPRFRSALAVVQLALSLSLLVGALLLVTTLRNLYGVDLGFDPAHLTTFFADLSRQGYTRARANLFEQDVSAALDALPGSQGVTIAQRAPFSSGALISVLPPGASAEQALNVNSNGVSHDYFTVLGTPILRGRAFTAEEVFATGPAGTGPVILDEALAQRLLGDVDPIGRTVRVLDPHGLPAELTVVGVVHDAHWNSIMGGPTFMMYEPLGRYHFGNLGMTAIVRSTQPVAAVAAEVRAAAAQLDRSIPVSGGQPLLDDIDRSIPQQRLFATMLTWISTLAFILAAVGLHGLVSQTTTERAREFGIRIALGASRAAIARLVARYVLLIGVAGTVAGLGLAAFGTRVVKTMLFGVTTLDPETYILAVTAMAVIVGVASAWPALRATRVQPVDVLRAE